MGNEGFERLGVEVEFPAETANDDILKRFGDVQMIADMQQVFFGSGQNPLGHSYASLIRGPDGRNDLQDVIALLRGEPWSKRAVITLCGNGHGKVPCINLVQFLVREGKVQTIYFARGQDAFRKFYADALCIASMARTVAAGLEVRAGTVKGFIGSCHIYQRDVPQIRKLLEEAKDDLGVESSAPRSQPEPLQCGEGCPSPPPSPLDRGEGELNTAMGLEEHFRTAAANGR